MWKDKDWWRRTLQVRSQMKWKKGDRFYFAQPKTKSGNRTIILGKQAVKVLHVHQSELQKLRREVAEKWVDLNLIFPSRLSTPVTASNLRRAFKKVLTASGLPKIRFHDLRHTTASLMLNHGVPILIASKRLGHSKPSITLDVYGHLMPNMQKEVADLMDTLISLPAAPIKIKNPRYTTHLGF